MDSDEESFLRYCRSVRQVASVAVLRVLKSLKFPVLLVRPLESASDGRRESRILGLGGGLRDRFLGEPFRVVEESSEVEAKCFELVGIGGIVGDWADKPYRDVFFRSNRGGEPRPVGVDTGDAR